MSNKILYEKGINNVTCLREEGGKQIKLSLMNCNGIVDFSSYAVHIAEFNIHLVLQAVLQQIVLVGTDLFSMAIK